MIGFPWGAPRFLFGGLPRFWNCNRLNLAELKEGQDGWMWVVPRCDKCGGRHVHGGGFFHENPLHMLGHRTAYCCRGYILVERDPAHTLKTIRAREIRQKVIIQRDVYGRR